MSWAVDELKDVRVGDVKVKDDCSVFVDSSSSELLVEAAVDFPKRYRA